MIGDKMQLANAIFGNDGNDGARRVTATAKADSTDGKVTVEFADGETATIGTIAPVSKGQKVTMVLQNGQATVIGADGWGDGIEVRVEQTETGLKSTVTKADADTLYASKTEFEQTSESLTAKISEVQGTANDAQSTANNASTTARGAAAAAATTATMIRAYGDGVIVAKPGQNIGALVNADGSFDVVALKWSLEDEPTPVATLSTFGANSARIGEDALRHLVVDNDSVDIMDGTTTNATFTASGASFADGDLIIDTTELASGIVDSRVRSVGNLGLYAEGYSSIILGQHTASGGYISDMGLGVSYSEGDAGTETAVVGKFNVLQLDGTTLDCNGVSGALPADWIVESGDGAGWNIPDSTTKQTALNKAGWQWHRYRSGKVHMWGFVASGAGAYCTQLSNGIYRETASRYIAFPVAVKYIRSMQYSWGYPGFDFGCWAVPADNSTGYWSPDGNPLYSTGFRFCSMASGTRSIVCAVDIWATV